MPRHTDFAHPAQVSDGMIVPSIRCHRAPEKTPDWLPVNTRKRTFIDTSGIIDIDIQRNHSNLHKVAAAVIPCTAKGSHEGAFAEGGRVGERRALL